ncbi:hypothetical protein [Aeromicrobium sp. UC242_57]|uniref:hypothetical protein n=1 Tax=Aeromicrobium sp. UC242_57 TaxID=3374624 RepID=UPI0037B655E9
MSGAYEDLRTAIGKCDDGGAIVTHFITVAEVIQSDGSATIQTISDVDHAWQVLGMLHHALLIAERDKYGDSE